MSRILFLTALLFAFCSFHSASGATWYVDGSVGASGDGTSWENALKTIREAINASSHGDTVLVAEGTYVENIKFNDKNITLTSTDPLDSTVVANTIIDGNQSGSVVTFSGTENENCVLSGFTITNGLASLGGGIQGCPADGTPTRATILSNVIRGNSATVGLGFGGGLYKCSGLIQNNLIFGNSAAQGGGLFACFGVIENNTICDNSSGAGSGLTYCNTVRNCIIWGNRPGWQLWESWVPIYSCVERWPGGGKGNIDYYPYFVDASHGDYHLKPWSPCIDAGDPASPFSREPQPNGGRINMGAYGNTPEAERRSADTDNDGLPDDWETEFLGGLSHSGSDDPDGDAIPNIEEYQYAYDPTIPADIWYVDGAVSASGDGRSWHTAFKTIQEGIDPLSDGDTVIVAQGTYVENIKFNGKNIILTSTDPLDATVVSSTIIDGGGGAMSRVVEFYGTETQRARLCGFTIRNGEYTGVVGGHATIERNVVTANKGAGLTGCNGLIRNNIICGNGSRGDGGGLSYGGGLSFCDGIIENNTIYGNRAGEDGGALAFCDGIIQNNTIYGNRTEGDGGALVGCSGIIRNNTICGNIAEQRGGGLAFCDGTIRNCIIWGNTGLGETPYYISPEGAQQQIYGSSAPTYSCIEGWAGGGVGNISDYPYFVDAVNGDFHLRSWSPCVDAGDPTSSFSREPLPNGGRVNMGAYGNTPEATSKSPDSDRDGLPDDWEMEFFGTLIHGPSDDPDSDLMSNMEEYERGLNPAIPANTWHVDGSVASSGDGRSWETAFKRIQEGIDAASEGDTVVVAQNTYLENIRFNGADIVLCSTDPLDPSVVAETVIDGNAVGRAVTFQGAETYRCILSGFTIQNGKRGISGWSTRATIRSNAITRNADGGVTGCDGIIENNTISYNAAPVYGGGLSGCDGVIRRNRISENTAITGGGLLGCNGLIVNNLILRNTARAHGGGLAECKGTIQNNTICGNTATKFYGGGLYLISGIISNCIIYDNKAGLSGPQLYDSSEPEFSCIQNFVGGIGNISENPRFADTEYRLAPNSPCIDAGKNEAWMWDAVDLDGNPRIWRGRTSLTVDMGAYEFGSLHFKIVGVAKAMSGGVELTWSSRPGHIYTFWSCSDLTVGDWTAGATIGSGGETTVWIDPDTTSSRKFYRIEAH